MFDCCLDKLKYKLCEIKDKCCGHCDEEQLFDLLIIEHEFDDFQIPDPTKDMNIKNGIKKGDVTKFVKDQMKSAVLSAKKTEIKINNQSNRLTALRIIRRIYENGGNLEDLTNYCVINGLPYDFISQIEPLKISVSGTSSLVSGTSSLIHIPEPKPPRNNLIIEFQHPFDVRKVTTYLSSVMSGDSLSKSIDYFGGEITSNNNSSPNTVKCNEFAKLINEEKDTVKQLYMMIRHVVK